MKVDFHMVIGQCLYIPVLAFGFVVKPVSRDEVLIPSLVMLSFCTIVCLSFYYFIEQDYDNDPFKQRVVQFIRWIGFPTDLLKMMAVPTLFTALMMSHKTLDYDNFFIALLMVFIILSTLTKVYNYIPPDEIYIHLPRQPVQIPPVRASQRPQPDSPTRSPPVRKPARRRPASRQTHADDWVRALVEALRCCVCYETLAADVVMCERGHAICRVCKERGVPYCPQCYQHFLPLHCNTLLKQVLDTIPQRYQEH